MRRHDAFRFTAESDNPQHAVGKLRDRRQAVLQGGVFLIGLSALRIPHDALDPFRIQLALANRASACCVKTSFISTPPPRFGFPPASGRLPAAAAAQAGRGDRPGPKVPQTFLSVRRWTHRQECLCHPPPAWPPESSRPASPARRAPPAPTPAEVYRADGELFDEALAVAPIAAAEGRADFVKEEIEQPRIQQGLKIKERTPFVL